MRSIVSRLGKKVISLIPQPLILPKLVEETEAIHVNSCLVDVWYGHTTVTIIANNEILWFETFPYGTEMLMEMIASYAPDLSLLQLENIICTHEELSNWKYRECLDDFLLYLQDAIFGYLQTEHIDMRFEYLFLHGNIFENSIVYTEFTKDIEVTFWYKIKKKNF